MIRIATIGSGAITTLFAEAVARTPGIRIEAVFSRDLAKARDIADGWGAAAAYSDLDEMLASPDVDAVYIASPNSVHAEQVRAALRAGRHVLVEKPAVLSADEWGELVAEADAAGVVLLEAFRTDYDPGFVALVEMLPELGTLRRASLRFEGLSSRYAKVRAGEHVNIFDSVMGGGALLDLGVYGLHTMVTLFGAPDRVAGEAVTISTGVEGAGAVIAAYPGLVVDVSYSKITRSSLPSEIQGEHASVEIDHIASPRRLTISGADGTRTVTVEGEQHALDGEVARFVELVATEASATADQDRTTETLRLLDALRAR
ncbi:Gfo/Idh/MocA family protein [Microbacterium sp. A1-JK]|uniref:Gfo/Idh/MocA family protein n=1 Tax=Microbacterium sp. A1-JK TaxID=3177516 RepID=UPI003886C66C